MPGDSSQREDLNASWELMGISPLKTYAVSKASKVKEVYEKINRSIEKQKYLAKELFDLKDRSQLDRVDDEQKDPEVQEKARILIVSWIL